MIMYMKRVVLIDGENLVYGLRRLLGNEQSRSQRSMIDGFNFKGMIDELLADNPPQSILWFGAKLKRYDHSPDLVTKSEQAIRSQASFMNHIQTQKIQFIKVGYLRARESDPCEKCQNQSWKLTEKGVDVGLAVRMLTEAGSDTELVVISADTDLLPAFKAATKAGSKIMHIGYEFRPVHALFSSSDTSRTITLPIAQKYLRVQK